MCQNNQLEEVAKKRLSQCETFVVTCMLRQCESCLEPVNISKTETENFVLGLMRSNYRRHSSSTSTSSSIIIITINFYKDFYLPHTHTHSFHFSLSFGPSHHLRMSDTRRHQATHWDRRHGRLKLMLWSLYNSSSVHQLSYT